MTMDQVTQAVSGGVSFSLIADVAQVTAAVFVAWSFRRDAADREFQAFLRLNERWDAIADMWRREGIQEKDVATQRRHAEINLGFAEVVSMLINDRRLRNPRLVLHWEQVLEDCAEILESGMFPEERADPKMLPEFKELRRKQGKPIRP